MDQRALPSTAVNVSGPENHLGQVLKRGIAWLAPFLSIERPAVREAIINFVMELSAINNKRL